MSGLNPNEEIYYASFRMDPDEHQLIDLIENYRKETSLQNRLDLATFICSYIHGDLRLFIFRRVHPSAAEDVLQETLIAIFTNLSKFTGSTNREFLAWCYRIARNKVSNHYREKDADRLEPFPTEELWKLAEGTAEHDPDWKYERIDVELAMRFLEKSKPECREHLWNRYVIGLDIADMAEELQLNYDAVRMRINRCLEIIREIYG